MKYLGSLIALGVVLGAAPAVAQEADAPPVTVSGSVALVSDYRFRGVSQTDEELAIQGGMTVAHESGLYAGVWGSNLAGWGTFGGSNTELDVFAGYATTFGSTGIDIGLTWYMFPGGADNTDFGEIYLKAKQQLGPVGLLAGVAYAPEQKSLGQWYNTGAAYLTGTPDNPNAKGDNFYVWSDASLAIGGTPLTAKAHLGYSSGNGGLGPNGTSVAPTGDFLDWMLGVDLAVGKLTFGVSYVDTDISLAESVYIAETFSSTKDGGPIADGQVVFSVTAAF